MSDDSDQDDSANFAERIACLERGLDRAERLLGRVIVTTMVASATARHVGHEMANLVRDAGIEPAIAPLLTKLQEQMDLLSKAVAEASDAE